jgi:hypothetical protein
MNAWGDLIQRLTRRLEVDEELRLDVARELHGHLEDSASQFRAAGQSEAEAAASAAKALGDEGELAEQLWQANRPRIRLRGVLRWTARVTLLPAAAVVTLVLVTYLLGIGGYVRAFSRGNWWGTGPGWPMGPLGELVCDPYVGVHLTADHRLLLEGAPDTRTDLDKAKSITDRWPDNRIYYANYVAHLLSQPGIRKKRTDDQTEQFDEVMLAQALAALRKGERIDPDNAFYNAEAASLLIQASSTLREDPSATYEKLNRKGELEAGQVFTIEVTDPQRFQEGLEEFHRALGKPLWTTWSVEMLRQRLKALGAPTRLIQYLNRLTLWAQVPLPGLGDARELGKSLGAYARVLAGDGRGAQAVQLLEDVRRLAARMGAQSGTFLIQLIVAQRITTHALGCEEVLYRDLHRSAQAAQARQERMKEYELYNRIMAGRRPMEGAWPDASLFELAIMPSLPGYVAALKPVRRAEQFAMAEAALAGLLVNLALAAVVLGLVSVVERVFVRKVDRGVLVFVGWRRLGRILLLGLAAPLAAYAVYVVIGAVWGGEIGFSLRNATRIMVELAAVVVVVLGLVVGLSRSAIRQRARELGLTVPRASRWRDRIVMLVVTGAGALAVIVYVAGWWAGPFRPAAPTTEVQVPAVVTCVAVDALIVLWLVQEWLVGLLQGRAAVRFRRTVVRSIVPILAAAVIVLGVAMGGVLAVGEGWAIRQTGSGLPMPDEIANSDFRLLRDHYVELDRAFRAGGEGRDQTAPSPH